MISCQCQDSELAKAGGFLPPESTCNNYRFERQVRIPGTNHHHHKIGPWGNPFLERIKGAFIWTCGYNLENRIAGKILLNSAAPHIPDACVLQLIIGP